MRTDAAVSLRPIEASILSVWSMQLTVVVSVSPTQSEINHIHDRWVLPTSHHEVVWFDISADESFGMQRLYSLKHLYRQDYCSFDTESPSTKSEKFH